MPYSDNFWILLDSFTQITPSLSGVVVQKLLAFGIVHHESEIRHTLNGRFPDTHCAAPGLYDPGMTTPKPVLGKSVPGRNRAVTTVCIPKISGIRVTLTGLTLAHIAAAIEELPPTECFYGVFVVGSHADLISAEAENLVMQCFHGIEHLLGESRFAVIYLMAVNPPLPIITHRIPVNRRRHLLGCCDGFQAILAFSCKCHLVTSAGFRSLSILAMISSRFSPLGIESL